VNKVCAKQQPLVVYDDRTGIPDAQDCACAADGLGPVALHSGPAAGDTDCACVPAAEEAPAHTAALHGRWRLAPGLYTQPLTRDYQAVFNPGRPAGVAVLNAAARDLLQTFQEPRLLSDCTSHTLAALGVLVPHDAQQNAGCPPDHASTVTAWLHVTNACDLGCAYCYVHKDGSAMDAATGRAAVDAVFRSAAQHGFRAVKLKYAGGEPTLNFSLIRLLHAEAHTQAERKGLVLRETLISNGVRLPDDVLAFVAETGMHLSVSLDFCSDAHNRQRARRDGYGAYEQVRRNVERAGQYGIRPHLSITVTGAEDERSPDAVQLALDMGLPFNLNFVRPADGWPADDVVAGVIRSVRLAFAAIESKPPAHSLLAVLDRADFSQAHRRSCGAGRTYLVIDHRGRVSPCQMQMHREVGDIRSPDPLAAVRGSFSNPPVDERCGCAACAWRYACGGGCPLMSRPTGPQGEGTSSYCAAYRALYPELIRLEGLRLLKSRRLC